MHLGSFLIRSFILTATVSIGSVGAFTIQRSQVTSSSSSSSASVRNVHASISSRAPTVLHYADGDADADRETILEEEQLKNSSKSSASSSSSSLSTGTATSPAESLPWGSRQTWALRDNLSKYLIDIPQLPYDVSGLDGKSTSTTATATTQQTTYALWQALTRDVIELAGYDIPFLLEKYPLIHETNDNHDDNNEDDSDNSSYQKFPRHAPRSLPLLDQFEFQTNGGVSGKIRGLNGIADGTTVQTSPLVHVQLTVPRGYVLTEDGTSAYELGIPLNGNANDIRLGGSDGEGYSLDITKMGLDQEALASLSKNTVQSGVETTGRVASAVVETMGDKETTDLLINLGATTAVLLASATAMNMLSHHLTVNVFWV